MVVVRTSPTSWWMRLYRIGRFERGVFAEIGSNRRATWQVLGIVVIASLAGGWQFLRKDGDWHVADWLLDEGGTAIAATIAAALLLWTVARIAGRARLDHRALARHRLCDLADHSGCAWLRRSARGGCAGASVLCARGC